MLKEDENKEEEEETEGRKWEIKGSTESSDYPEAGTKMRISLQHSQGHHSCKMRQKYNLDLYVLLQLRLLLM